LTVRTTSLDITVLHAVGDLEPRLADWRRLAAGMPMRLPEWLLGWWEAFAAEGDRLWIVLLNRPGGETVGIAPLYLQADGTLRLLGAAEACSHHPDWLCAPGWESQVGEEVAGYLLARRSEWKKLLLQAVDEEATAILTTADGLARGGCLLHRRRIQSCWKIPLPESWEAYLGTLSSSLRKRCRKLQRQFFDSGRIRVREVETGADLQRGFEILLKLHAARWGNDRQPRGVFENRRFRRFHEQVAPALLAGHRLRLAWLECDGRPIAVEYQFVDDKAVYAYQAGIDLDMKEYAPGKLTMMAAIQFALERGCKFFDLLGGDEPYKANWRAVPTASYDLRAWQAGIRGRVEWALWSGYTWAARRLKSCLPPHLIDRALRFLHAARDAWANRGGGG